MTKAIVATIAAFLLLSNSAHAATRAETPGDEQSASEVSQARTLVRIPRALGGQESNGRDGSSGFTVSRDGQHFAFTSDADNLVPNDTNKHPDVFVYDAVAKSIERVSVSSSGDQIPACGYYCFGSNFPSGGRLSSDGRFVVFEAGDVGLVPGDDNDERDIFLHDRETGETTIISMAPDGASGKTPEEQPRYCRWCPEGSTSPDLSDDGRYVAFASSAANLVPGDTNNRWDIFVYDRQTSETRRVSVGSDGTQASSDSFAPSLSGDGRLVAFSSAATNLTPRVAPAVPLKVNVCFGTYPLHAHVPVVWLGVVVPVVYKEPCLNVFVHEMDGRDTRILSRSHDGGMTNGHSFMPRISGDGSIVAFSSDATNLIPNDLNGDDSDVFTVSSEGGASSLVSKSSEGDQGNGDSYSSSINGDGSAIVFQSEATNLVSGDTNALDDVFVRDHATTTLVSSSGEPSNGRNAGGDISADGSAIVFRSSATNLVAGDANSQSDGFVSYTDDDRDAVGDLVDNCVDVANPDQADRDDDGFGDACDDDDDNDGVANNADNCPTAKNPPQDDADSDGVGDECDDDDDGDLVPDEHDNCPTVVNPTQGDVDHDGSGDACDDRNEVEIDVSSDRAARQQAVIVFSTEFFDARRIDVETACFGGADDNEVGDCSEEHGRLHVEDADGDGDADVILHFSGTEAGITASCLRARLTDGTRVIGCRS